MTNQNNAAQAAEQDPLSDEYVNAVIQRHGYQSPETVIARLWQWIGRTGGENGVTLLMYEAHKALVKLRAPVAEIHVGVSATGRDATICIMQPHADGSITTIYSATHPLGDSMGRAALASAPVADESPMAKAAEALREKARQERQAYQDRREADRVASAPVAGEAPGTNRQGLLEAIHRYGNARAMAQHNIAYRDEVRKTAGALVALFDAAPQASEAVRIQFPAHLRKMWSGGEVQAWLDEHQGVTPPKVSAKGSLERYRKWQAEREEAFGAGVKAAADLVKKMVDDYDTDHGSTDPETGTREYPGDGAAWVCDMEELEGSIRALSAQPAQKEGGSDAN